ncbi:hypothetical protein [Paenibacillus rhizophilus]|uniref:hypothetical protein n=1 Tax=Paenibacillus rhizophilus TaxID=1850366 RepID=UPI001639C858|nr:hypothetical protein [Paenibacillus rhizophilus]
MSWEPVWFMVFSNLEAFAWCALCMAMFRYKTSEYVWPILIIITLMNLQSYILRNEFSLSYLAPTINILFVTLLFAAIVKESLLGSIIIAAVGFLGFGLIQALIAVTLFGSISGVGASKTNGYVLQISTAIIVIPLSWFMYRYGHGFSFDFEKFRVKNEKLLLVTLILIFMIMITFVLYLNQIWNVIVLFVISLLFFLKYAIEREKDI